MSAASVQASPEHDVDRPSTFTVIEPDQPAYARSPVVAIRLVGSIAVLAVMFLALRRAEGSRFSEDLGALLETAPRWIVSVIVSASQFGFLVPALLGFVVQLGLRRFARVGRMLLAAAICVAGLFVMAKLLGGTALPLVPPRHHRGVTDAARPLVRYGIGAPFPAAAHLGIIASWMFVDRNRWSDRWKRLGLVVLALGAVAHIGVTLNHPAIPITAITMAAVGSGIAQLVLGAPNTRPRGRAVGDVLVRLGYSIVAVEEFGGFREYVGYAVVLDDGRHLFVKIVNRDSWAVLLPVRLYRAARYRDIGQERPFRSLRTIVEHEALCALKAHSDGVPTARVAALTEFPPDAMLMAFDAHSRRRLSEVDWEGRTDELLSSVWHIVATLQRSHTVHRNLNADSLWVDDDGVVVVLEFRAASIGVVDAALATDVAEVLAASAGHIGPERAVAIAVASVGHATVASALPRLQPLALTRHTRQAVKAAGCLDALRDEVQRVTGVDAVPIAELERIKSRTIVSIAMVAIAVWTLVPQFTGVGSVWGELLDANWRWAVAVLGLSFVTYIAAAVSLEGATPERLPFGPNVGVHFATSFVAVAAPGGALALTTRFLQRRGIDTPRAIGAVGADVVVGGVVHFTLVGLFITLAGTSGLETFDLPSWTVVGWIAAAVAALAAAGVALPWTRRQLTTRIIPATKRSLTNVGEIARQPVKMIELFGGSFAITMGYLLALAAAVAAFGPGPAFTSVALVYLVATIISSVAPTPGGVGAVEATLIAGLTSAGLPSTTAVAAVVLFRLATFWIPLVPGWLAFLVLQRSGEI